MYVGEREVGEVFEMQISRGKNVYVKTFENENWRKKLRCTRPNIMLFPYDPPKLEGLLFALILNVCNFPSSQMPTPSIIAGYINIGYLKLIMNKEPSGSSAKSLNRVFM